MAVVAQTLHRNKWHDRYPELGTGPIPIEPYISREYFEKERERIFRKVWLNIGRVEQIPSSGDYFVKDLAMCNTSILVVRGKDGVIRAFHNMCSHRGNQLVWDHYVSNGTYLTHIFWPLAENRTRWEVRTYSPKAKTLAARFSQEYGKVSFRDTLLEDGSTLERTQSMLGSGAKKEIQLQDEELLIRQHHKVTETYLNA